ncbi:hypothetical protein N3K66_004622 [Trichothecium roseum]|uniref:Uncharacterized protein n=1 Tax=Trichothecium roseum TaxID=47278 RepID=A0ACC0V1T6_9HYPO|nr:hypothetical protein N3K66_004622 [Trichothecium roseum]
MTTPFPLLAMRRCPRLAAAAARHHQPRGIATTAPRLADQPRGTTELGVGELEGAKFRIEPLRRVGEDSNTMRARLIYQSRKRGTLESDLLLSTFAQTHLPNMTHAQMTEYDLFLDENDWDIYYWATQLEPDGAGAASNAPVAESPASATSPDNKDDVVKREPPSGEWAQTVGNFRPAYRPVPARWRESDVLALLREHVKRRSVDGGEGKGMGFMPPLDSK